MAKNVPVSVSAFYQTAEFNVQTATIAVGDNRLVPARLDLSTYWYVVVSLHDLSIVVNELTQDFTDVPDGVRKFSGSDDHMLILSTINLFSSRLVQGDAHRFLVDLGAGVELRSLEQFLGQAGTGQYQRFAYILAATMSTKDNVGFEAMSLVNPVFLTFEMIPIDVGGKTVFRPAELR